MPHSWWPQKKASCLAAGEKLNVVLEAARAALAAWSKAWGLTRTWCLLRCQASIACIRQSYGNVWYGLGCGT